ncbi:hypothetical protein ACT3UJ_06985 [Halomonas sp. 86]|uniref:hypothetical protein n=1 Tax=Halomonas TaxID=2745 RepID=UPI003CECCEFE
MPLTDYKFCGKVELELVANKKTVQGSNSKFDFWNGKDWPIPVGSLADGTTPESSNVENASFEISLVCVANGFLAGQTKEVSVLQGGRGIFIYCQEHVASRHVIECIPL